jgi:hypothetical protein
MSLKNEEASRGSQDFRSAQNSTGIEVSQKQIRIAIHYLTNFATNTCDFEETMSQAPTQHTCTKKPLSTVSDDSSGESDGLEFGSEDDHDDNIEDGDDEEGDNEGDKDDSDEEGGSEGDEIEEEEYGGRCKFGNLFSQIIHRLVGPHNYRCTSSVSSCKGS